MAKETVEQTIKSVQKEIKDCKHEIERLQAMNEIQNLMGTYEYLHTANMHKEVADRFAKKAPGVRVYFGEVGYWEGVDAPRKAWSILERMGDTTGMMAIHPITTPVIVVSGDCKTAKGVWIGNGFVAALRGGKATSGWEWDKYGIDFIKEDGVWKFWHFRSFGLFSTPFNKSWVEEGPEPALPLPDELKPDRRPSPYYTYKTTVPAPYEPVLPEPFETFDEVEAY